MAAGKAQETLEHPHTLDAAGLDHRLGPGGALRAQPSRDPVKKPRSATLNWR